MFRDEFDAVVEQLGAGQEPPLDSERVSDPKKALLWGLADPWVDPVLFGQQLQQGFSPEDVQAMTIVQEHPELAEVFGQPQQDPGVIAELTELARYPFRLGTYNHIQDPDERVAEAERIHAAHLKRRPAVPPPAPAVPVAPPAAPTMPPVAPTVPSMPMPAPGVAPVGG